MSAAPDPLSAFGPATRAWFTAAFDRPTPVQVQGWAAIAAGRHALLLAPTGSGKTLAAFLWALDGLHHRPRQALAPAGVRVLYVSPMKALVYDIERNLQTPLAGIRAAAARLGLGVPPVSVAVRTGDTPAGDRRDQARHPADVLVTTPESLYLLLSSQARAGLATVETVIVDEIHAIAGIKRGVHLALCLERLDELVTRPDDVGQRRPAPQRIGLSATQRPLQEIAAFLGGRLADGAARPVAIVDASARPAIDLRVVVPVDDMENPGVPPPAAPALDAVGDDLPGLLGPTVLGPALLGPAVPAASSPGMDRQGIWPAIHPEILALIRAHRSTIVFTNSRRLCERMAQRLNELAQDQGLPVPLVRAHHGSVSHAERTEMEEALKAGRLRGIVATSSLELGIDMGAVDLVVLVESPGAVSTGLQRVGRAGHQVEVRSSGRIFPKYRADLLQAAVVVQEMERGAVEETRVPTNCLDVLAQHVVSMCLEGPWSVPDLGRVLRGAWPYRDLSEAGLVAVLDMLSGRYPGDELGELRPRLVWDRGADLLRARPDARLAVFGNPGTIPDRGLFGVYLAGDAAAGPDGRSRRGARGRRLGELDEEMVYESRNGDTVILGASTWRIIDIQRDRVLVEPAPGEPGRMPFWRGEGPGRPVGLGQAMGAFVRTVSAMEPDAAREHLVAQCRLDERAAGNLLAYLADQRAATGTLPTDRAITIERFRDELGDWRICILTPFGARVHAPWALALEASLGTAVGAAQGGEGGEGTHTGIQSLWTDDGIVLRFPDAELFDPGLQAAGGPGIGRAALPDAAALLPDPDEVEELVTGQLRHAALFAARFREAAVRSLLLTRRRPGQRAPLWAQRLAAQRLLAAASRHATFPVVLETYRECLQDVFDLPALVALLREVRARRVRVDEVETSRPSPFARNLVLSYVAEFLYEGDAPLAERKAQALALALALDRGLLRELLGQDELASLLDPQVVSQVESELQCLDPERRARSVDGLHDLLRRVGDLSVEELALRCRPAAQGEDAAATAAGTATAWLAQLVAERRAAPVRVAGQERFVAAEDLARYRDALGCVPPAGMPAALLAPSVDPLLALVQRHAHSHGPFRAAQVALRLGLRPPQVEPVLQLLLSRGSLVSGGLIRGGLVRGGQPAWEGAGPDYCEAEVLRRIKRRTLAKRRGEVAPVDGAALARFQLTWHGIWTSSGRAPGGPALLDEAVLQLEGCALPFSELERRILPARVPGFQPALLDELGASGALVWVGQGRLGPRDGRVALYRREQLSLLLAPPPPAQELAARGELPWSPVHAALVESLQAGGARFTVELQQDVARRLERPLRAEALQGPLWDLVWAGLLTNDTLQPLRGLSAPARRGGGARQRLGGRSLSEGRLGGPPGVAQRPTGRLGGRLGGGLGGGGGRWSLVAALLEPSGPGATASRAWTTQVAHARAVMLLERYGLVAAGHARAEGLPGGFSAVYEVLRGLEEAGRARRGHFVEGLEGAQFALPGAVDRMRACREEPQPGDDPAATGAGATVLAATDPACPWGLALPWPASGGSGSPRRAAGASVAVVDGRPVLFVDAGGRSGVSFAAVDDPESAARAVTALRAHLGQAGHKGLRIEQLDGQPALDAPAAAALVTAGLDRGRHALTLHPRR